MQYRFAVNFGTLSIFLEGRRELSDVKLRNIYFELKTLSASDLLHIFFLMSIINGFASLRYFI